MTGFNLFSTQLQVHLRQAACTVSLPMPVNSAETPSITSMRYHVDLILVSDRDALNLSAVTVSPTSVTEVHSHLPTSARSSHPYGWEGATLVAPAIRAALAWWPELLRPTHHDGASPVNYCRGERSTVPCVSFSTTS